MQKIIIIISLFIVLGIGIYFFFFQGKWIWDIKVAPVIKTPASEYEKQKSEIKDENQKNIELYNTAIQDQNPELCNGIVNIDKKNECHDMIIAATAKKIGDINTCDTLTNTGNTILCRDIIRTDRAINSHNKILCMKISVESKRSYCEDQIDESILSENVKNNTITKDLCDWLWSKYQQSCISNIHEIDESTLYKEAVEKNELALCKKITGVEFQSACTDTINLKTAIDTQNSLLCDEIISIEKKTYCQNQLSKTNDISLYKSALSNWNLEDCANIINENLRNKCHDTIIISSVKSQKDITLCDHLTSTGMIDSCKQIWQ